MAECNKGARSPGAGWSKKVNNAAFAKQKIELALELSKSFGNISVGEVKDLGEILEEYLRVFDKCYASIESKFDVK